MDPADHFYHFSCGWGSGALFFAEMLPNAKVTAFSNSKTQKQYIDSKAVEKGLKNLTVITGNVVDYEFEPESFDRVVSVEVSLQNSLGYACLITSPGTNSSP